MEIKDFKEEFKNFVCISFNDELILHNTSKKVKQYRVYEMETQQSFLYNSLDEAIMHKFNGKTIADYIDEKEDMLVRLDGGRGSGSGGGSSLFGGQRGEIGPDTTTKDLPARMNRLYNGNKMSESNTISVFRQAHANSDSEHAIIYDDDGFVSVYSHGNKGSVTFYSGDVNGKNMIHNHPSDGWANFSKADLDSFANTGMKSLSATSSKVTYTIRKGNKFDADGFKRAVANAKTTEKNYDLAVDVFLRGNSKKYGYTYSATKH